MNNPWLKKSLPVLLLVLALGALVGCGTSKTSSSDFGGLSNLSSTNPSQSTSAVATCSQDVSGLPDLQVRLMQYADVYGSTRSDYVRLQFKMAPVSWQTGNLDMLVYRWTASSDNSTSLDSTPLSFQFERKSGAGFQLIDGTSYQILNFTEIQQVAAYAGVSAATPQDFFNSVTLLVNLKDQSNSYQALRVVLRQGGTLIDSVDLLIPTFLADPAKYNADTRHPITLQALHPLKDKLGQTWTDTNYAEFARAFCF